MRYKIDIGSSSITLPDGAVDEELDKIAQTHPEAAGVFRATLGICDGAPEFACEEVVREDIEARLGYFNDYLLGALSPQEFSDAILAA